MPTLISFIVGVIIGYLLLVGAYGSFVALLNSLFLQTVVVAFVGFLIYRIISRHMREHAVLIALPDSRSNNIKLTTTGAINLYLWGFTIPGDTQRFTRGRLIPTHIDSDAYYWLPPPSFKDLNLDETFEFTLYLEDEHGTKWISCHGGVLEKHPYQDGVFTMRVWSYRLEKENWIV